MTEYARVWDALAAKKEEADFKAAKSDLMIWLTEQVKWLNYTQAAEKLGITYEEVDLILTGRFSKLTFDFLYKTALKNGCPMSLDFKID